MKHKLQKLLLILLMAFYIPSANAADIASQHTDNTTIELLHNGQNQVLAHFSIQPDWHIYWSNPGDIGFPTLISSENSALQILNQSTPQIRTFYEDMTEYVYTDHAYYLLQLDNLSQARILFDFVECSDVCKPQKIYFNLSEIAPTSTTEWQQYITAAFATFPQLITLNAIQKRNRISITSPLPSPSAFIPNQRDIINPETVSIDSSASDPLISWQTTENPLSHALILSPDKAYFATIVYHTSNYQLFYIALLAFLGGIILNAMPCVFPILSLKIFALLQKPLQPRRAWYNALSYILGVLLSFLLLTTCLIWLKQQGENVGWGFQLQSPLFVGIMALIFFALFLLIMEWLPFPNLANKFIHKLAGLNEFLTGFFAVLIASPCTGPFMGAAVGYAFMQSTFATYTIFIALALGYALPYALIELYPNTLHHILPKPGKWMHTVKIILAIPVLLTGIWLSSICYTQTVGTFGTAEQSSLLWQPYDADAIAELNSRKENIFIDFTADWCLTCKFNEKIILNSRRFQDFVAQNNVHLFIADLTDDNEIYSAALNAYGRDSIPLYIYYNNGKYYILPLFFSISDLMAN